MMRSRLRYSLVNEHSRSIFNGHLRCVLFQLTNVSLLLLTQTDRNPFIFLVALKLNFKLLRQKEDTQRPFDCLDVSENFPSGELYRRRIQLSKLLA